MRPSLTPLPAARQPQEQRAPHVHSQAAPTYTCAGLHLAAPPPRASRPASAQPLPCPTQQATAAQQADSQHKRVEEALRGKLAKTKSLVASLQVVMC